MAPSSNLISFRRTLLALIVADVLFVLFVTFGYAFPSRMVVPDPQKPLPEAMYDYSAKSSPFPKQKVAVRGGQDFTLRAGL